MTSYRASINSLANMCGVSPIEARKAAYSRKFVTDGDQADIESFVKWARAIGATKRSAHEIIGQYFEKFIKFSIAEERKKVER